MVRNVTDHDVLAFLNLEDVLLVANEVLRARGEQALTTDGTEELALLREPLESGLQVLLANGHEDAHGDRAH